MYPRAYIYFTLALAMSIAGFFPSYFGRLGEIDLRHVMMRPIQEIGWWQSFGHWVANWPV